MDLIFLAVDAAQNVAPEVTKSPIGDYILQLGVGGLFAVVILTKVFDFLNKQKEKKNGKHSGAYGTVKCPFEAELKEDISELKQHIAVLQEHVIQNKNKTDRIQPKIYELHEWHNKDDKDNMGAKIWWGLDIKKIVQKMNELIRISNKGSGG